MVLSFFVFKIRVWILNKWAVILKQGLLEESGVSWCLLSHPQLQPYLFGCPSALCYFLSSIVYHLGYTCVPLKAQEAMFSHFAVNVQSLFGACLMCARAFPYYSPSADLTSCFSDGKAPSDMHLLNIMYTHCSKSNFCEQNVILWTHWYTVRRACTLVSIDWSNSNSHSPTSLVPSKANLHLGTRLLHIQRISCFS